MSDPNASTNSAPAGDTAAPAAASDTAEHMIPKSRLDEEIAKRRAAEAEVTKLVDEMVSDLPEQYRGLVPDGLGGAEKLAWLRKAKATGIFVAKVPPTDNGRPTSTPRVPDFNNLPTLTKIAASYGHK